MCRMQKEFCTKQTKDFCQFLCLDLFSC
uniref:Uncharacterized protein n=1 Tax=Rhizophora mucronata TaxID=61149 RepID=A0A2P2N6V8_RHIMU